MFVAVHNEKHLVEGTEIGGKFLCESGSHVPKCIMCVSDGRTTLCESEHCNSGTWFHFEYFNIIRRPRGKWFCPDCKIKK